MAVPKVYALPSEPSEEFVKILQKIQADYLDKKIIVFDMGLFKTFNAFSIKVKKLIDQHQLKNVELLDTSKFINCDECYYNLDFHITPKGHAILADSLAKRIKI